METTPKSNRMHIGIFGKRNAGKSSLINAISGQEVAIVSSIPGTTADSVFKAMELRGIGAVTLIDTAGFDDIGELGEKRVHATKEALQMTNLAILVITDNENLTYERQWVSEFKRLNIPHIVVFNDCDLSIKHDFCSELDKNYLVINCKSGKGVDGLLKLLEKKAQELFFDVTITPNWIGSGDVIMLIMPQDEAAPKGRIILPQVQTLRELLDKNCVIVCSTPQNMQNSFNALTKPPKLIITDSQVFSFVYDNKPKESLLTSFSVLFAGFKGDIDIFLKGAEKLDYLKEDSHILIAEACTHAPIGEDIGRIKIPNLLRRKLGDALNIEVVSGTQFPTNLTKYDLIIHCGACMFNRKHVLNRILQAKEQGVAITNYGIVIAKLNNILDKIAF